MAVTREKKAQLLEDYVENLQKSHAIVLTTYAGLTHKELSELRNNLRENGARFQVVKNNIFKLAMEKSGLSGVEDLFVGPVGVTYVYDDPVAAAKVLMEFAKTRDLLQVKGGLLGEQVLSPESVKSLASLPTREVLLAQVLAGMQAPISGLVNVLAGTVRGLVNVLNARADQLKESESAA